MFVVRIGNLGEGCSRIHGDMHCGIGRRHWRYPAASATVLVALLLVGSIAPAGASRPYKIS